MLFNMGLQMRGLLMNFFMKTPWIEPENRACKLKEKRFSVGIVPIKTFTNSVEFSLARLPYKHHIRSILTLTRVYFSGVKKNYNGTIPVLLKTT